MNTHNTTWQRFSALAFGTLLGAAGAVCAETIDLPDIGDSAGALVSPEQERRLGEAVLRQAHQYGVMIDDPEAEAYFQSLGQQLASYSEGWEGEFTFFLIKADSINAFAVPGGIIGAHTGLILNSKSESEVAAVLAHEVSHITQRHGVRGYEAASKMSLPMAAAMLGAILVGVANPDAAQAAIVAVAASQQQFQLNFTRANEQEADRIGIQLLHRAGFDTDAMANFFERLQIANRYSDPKSYPEYLRSHPVTINRIAEARERAEKLGHQKHADSESYQLVRAKLKVLVAEDPKQLLEQYEHDLRSGNFENERVARYGYALALTRTGEYGKARLQIAQLLAQDPEQQAYLLAQARLEIAAGNVDGGLQDYESILRLFPGSRPVLIGYIDALLRAGRGTEARALLRDYAYDYTVDPQYFKMLAEAEDQSGSPIESHIALAEYYFHLGETPMALQQLEIAQRAPQIDYYQRERVLARMDEMKAELEESMDERHRRGDSRGLARNPR
ncbi:MAG: M48 family metallopeptidase [Gammaproteobacteria bacterium]|nr:M48 family metallopeptidase [Gammaproteobacteria bacterium]